MGLPILECPDVCDKVDEGDTVQVCLESGAVTIEKDGTVLQAQSVPEFMQSLLKEGGLMNYVKKKLKT
jgi:3-isopropylmalate/(R)-2-methylmalate dehydratase small subunit